MTTHMDNQGALFMAGNEVNNKRTKHIDIRYHAIRDWIKKKLIKLFFVSTDDNVADIFTKALNSLKTIKFRTALGVVKPSTEASK